MKSKDTHQRMRPARAKASDKRDHIRFPVHLKVDIESPNNHYLFEMASNISETGIFIQTIDPLEPGTHINLQFHLPDENSIRVRGEVIWVNHDEEEPGMGIKFMSMDLTDRHRILSALKKLAIL